MDREGLEKRLASLEAELHKAEAMLFRLQGAITLAKELLAEAEKAGSDA